MPPYDLTTSKRLRRGSNSSFLNARRSSVTSKKSEVQIGLRGSCVATMYVISKISDITQVTTTSRIDGLDSSPSL